MDSSTENLENSVSDEEKEFAKTALTEFDKKNYAECLDLLNKFENAGESNWRLIHNRAVVEFYKNELCNYEQYEKVLSQITDGITMIENFEIKDPDKCIAYYNVAVLLYHLRQPFAALKILMEIINNIKQIDDFVVQRVGLLTINLLLDTNRPRQAQHILELVQNRLGISKDSWVIEDDDDLDIDPNDRGNEKRADEFRKMFKFCFIRTNLLNGKNIIIPTDELSDYCVLKAHQYYLGNDYQMAAKELSKKTANELFTVGKHGEDQNTCLANNMGLIHFSVRHYAMAVRFLQHALQFDQDATENVNKDSILHTIGSSKRPEILYNLGVAMLYLQRPKEAFECLLVPLNYHHNNPKLWLRLAEACIMVYKQSTKSKENPNLVSSVIGNGIYRKYVLQPTPHKYISDEGQSFAIPSPNLEFASLCLRNALTLVEHLANQVIEDDCKDDEIQAEVRETGYSCNPSKSLTQIAFDKLKCAVLAAYSYVLISLGEYVLALKYGKILLQLKHISDPYKMLGHLYCAESLIMMNRPNEALAFLEPKFIAELRGDEFETSGSPNWNITSAEAAQSVMSYNWAVTYLIQGEIELAKTALIACKHPIVLTQLKMLKIYMDLLVGNVEGCRQMIRHDTPQFL